MAAVRLYKQIGIVLLLASVLTATSGLRAGNRRIPSFKRAGSGYIFQGYTNRTEPVQAVNRPRVLLFDGISRRNVLDRARKRRRVFGAAAVDTDTIRVVLIRISFETDRETELSSIYTGGDFDLTPDGSGCIDPIPHNRSYFDSHMKGLRNYVFFQSCGRVEIGWDVYPSDENSSYKLSDIADYGPGYAGAWTIERLVAFFRDAILTADQSVTDPVPFDEYDAIVIAHAGANLQSDINYDTPNDIPSFFARLGDDDRFVVSSGDTIFDGSVIPETAIQDGLIGGVASVLAHEFGHQLGLPDLYNTFTNGPTIGRWDIMDSGGFSNVEICDEEDNCCIAVGVVPTGLSAWCRTFLGWTEVDTVMSEREELSLPAVEKCPARVVRVEACEDEYFLIENRASEVDGLLTGLVVDENGVIIGIGSCTDCGGSPPSGSEWELTNEYDFYLPTEAWAFDAVPTVTDGPGLLIWHVDERLITERFEENVVNSSRPFGLTLLEANGVVDLGDPTSWFDLGWYDDAYYNGNNASLSDSTLPASWSNWGVPTGVKVWNVSSRDTLMSFSAGVLDLEGTVLSSTLSRPAANGALPLPGGFETLLIDEMGTGWLAGTGTEVFRRGAPVVLPAALASDFSDAGDAVVFGEEQGFVNVFNTGNWEEPSGWNSYYLGSSLVTHPVVASTGGDVFIVAATADNRLHVINRDGLEENGISPVNHSDSIVSNIVVASDSNGTAVGLFFVAAHTEPSPSGWLFRYDIETGAGGTPLTGLPNSDGYPQFMPLSKEEAEGEISVVGGDVDPFEQGDEAYIVLHATGRVLLYGDRGRLSERSRERSIPTVPALQDVNGDSYLELLYSDGYSMYAVGRSGANVRGWPRTLMSIYQLPWETRISAPITAINTTAGLFVIAGTEEGLLYVFASDGELLHGYPRKVSRSFDSAVDMVSVSGRCGVDESGTLLAYLDGGYYRWRRTPFTCSGMLDAWAYGWGDIARTAYTYRSVGGIAEPDEWLMLASNLVVYPNPSGGDRVYFHFTAPEQGQARLEIMTLTGELVLEDNKNLSGGEEEFNVSMSDKASGVYICRLVVTSRGQKTEAYRKFAIVR